MFRDQVQRARVCQALLAGGPLEHLWSEQGPTEEAEALCETNGATLDQADALLLSAAWSLWDGRGWASLGDLLGAPLAANALVRLASLLLALGSSRGPAAIDEWLAEWTDVGAATFEASPSLAMLNQVARRILAQPRVLAPAEARFLRKVVLRLRQDELAAAMGLTKVAVVDWERGERPLSKSQDDELRRLARAKFPPQSSDAP